MNDADDAANLLKRMDAERIWILNEHDDTSVARLLEEAMETIKALVKERDQYLLELMHLENGESM